MKKEARRRRKGTKILLVMLFIIGLLITMYPFISDFWNQMRTESIVSEYRNDVERMPSKTLQEEYRRARSYNDSHSSNVIFDIFSSSGAQGEEYMSLLNPGNDNVMGYIEIPKIKQRIVIYHGTSEEVLQKGCGHIAGTSLPIGGNNSHAVLAAHRGLPSAKLFTDIDELKSGDLFYLFVLDNNLAYEVDQIKVVEPDCLEDLQIVEGQDLVTLFTCTPYSINTHRLLIRGHRVPFVQEDNTNNMQTDSYTSMKAWVLGLIFVLLTIIIVLYIKKKKIKKKRQLKGG